MGDCFSKDAAHDHSERSEALRTMNAAPETHEVEKAANLESCRIQEREDKIKQNVKAKTTAAKPKRQTIAARPLNLLDDFQPPKYPKTDQNVKFLDGALAENFIFADLSKKERRMLIDAMQKQEATEGDVIIKQGAVGDFFYVCESGRLNYVVDGNIVGSCSGGASFGELALLYDAPRAATCVASSAVQLWKVDQTTFRHLIARQAKDEQSDIASLVAKVPLLQDMDAALVSKFAQVLTPVKFSEGELIVMKGSVGEVFYILNEGQVKVHDIGMGDSKFVDQILKAGDWFGERALMTGEPRAANVTAMTSVTAFACDRETFENSLGSLESILGHESKNRFLKGVPIFASSSLLEVEYKHLVDRLTEETYPKGHKLADVGLKAVQKLYIVKEGKLNVNTKDGKIFSLGSGDYFGDKAVKGMPDDLSEYNCFCDENTSFWVLTRKDIEEVIGDIMRLGESIPFVPSTINTSIQLKDVKKHRILGMGAFGRVWLASDTSKGEDPYALKMINKRQLLEANQIQGVLREKQIMNSIDHPFVLGLVGAFQDEEHLYLLLPLIQGGELFNVVHTEKSDGVPNESAVFYSACILEALAHLHDRNIVYRDMKPENALIDKNGYCIMVDLGFAKVVVDKTYTLCGTPEYLAPEIIMSKGHDKGVDYWSFGVLIYELIVGYSPFYSYGTDQVSLFKRIVMVKYSSPAVVNPDAKDLLKKLLTRRQAARLGSLSGAHNDIREHPWFQSIDFKKLNNFEIPAPWVPNIKNPFDSSHFEDFSREEREKNRSRPLNSAEQVAFKDF
jgi:protein kinase A